MSIWNDKAATEKILAELPPEKPMKTWEVLVRMEAYIQVEAQNQDQAEAIAAMEFDPTAYDVVVVESFEVEEQQ